MLLALIGHVTAIPKAWMSNKSLNHVTGQAWDELRMLSHAAYHNWICYAMTDAWLSNQFLYHIVGRAWYVFDTTL